MGCCQSRGKCGVKDAAQDIEKNGYYVVRPRDININFFKQPMKGFCMPIRYKSMRRHLYIHPPENFNTTRTRLFENVPLYTTLTRAPIGVYTWLHSERGFFATPVQSVIELGTTHLNILTRSGHVPGDKVFAAGECIVNPGEIEYNIASGCISRYIDEKSKLVANAAKAFSDFDKAAIHVPIETTPTFIRTPVTESLLKQYQAMGYNVRLYHDASKCDHTVPPFPRTNLLNLRQTYERQGSANNVSQVNRWIANYNEAEMTGGKKTRKSKKQHRYITLKNKREA
jgi:hypothetical protein